LSLRIPDETIYLVPYHLQNKLTSSTFNKLDCSSTGGRPLDITGTWLGEWSITQAITWATQAHNL
jgi:hypothetical protein